MEPFIDGFIFGIAFALLCLPSCGVLLLSTVLLTKRIKVKENISSILVFILGKIFSIIILFLLVSIFGKVLLKEEMSYTLRLCSSLALIIIGLLMLKSRSELNSTKCFAVGLCSSIRICPLHTIVILKAFSLIFDTDIVLFTAGFILGNSLLFFLTGIFMAFLKKLTLTYSRLEYLRRVGASILVIEALLIAVYGI